MTGEQLVLVALAGGEWTYLSSIERAARPLTRRLVLRHLARLEAAGRVEGGDATGRAGMWRLAAVSP